MDRRYGLPGGPAEQEAWEMLTPEEKKRELYRKQKALLEEFLARGAISRAQFDKSLGDLTEKMGMGSGKR